MLKTLKHSFRMCPLRWQMRAHERRLYSRGLNHMSPDEIDEFLKEWEAKERPLNTRFVRLTTRRLEAGWWLLKFVEEVRWSAVAKALGIRA